MMSPAAAPISVQLELWENERRWVGGGFSKKGLFPTERGPFSTEDGSLSWRKLEEADVSELLLGKGWDWKAGSEFVLEPSTGEDCDDEGWSYAVDFSPGGLVRACSSQGMAHFARRRRLVRQKVFDPNQFATYEQCEYCDSYAVDSLSAKLLEALSIATLLQRDVDHTLTDAIALPLKAHLIDYLGINAQLPSWAGKVDSSTRLHKKLEELDTFAAKQQNVLSKASHMFQNDEQILKGLPERMALVSMRYFGWEERESISAIFIRQIDPEYTLHCGRETCGEDCEFYRVDCPNKGCDKRVSRKHLTHHADEECGFKILDCTNGCGDTLPKNRMAAHLKDACGLRDTQCPFHDMGCTVIVPAKDRARHVEESASSHLMLAAKRINEHQIQMGRMFQRIERLERENADLKKQASTTTEKLTKDVAAVEKQTKTTTKSLSALEKKCHAEFRAHKK